MWGVGNPEHRTAPAPEVDAKGRTVWKVEFPTERHDRSFQSTMQVLMGHESRANPAPLPVHAITRAFERGGAPKLVRQLGDPDPEIRRRANEAAAEFLETPLGRAGCLEAGVVEALVGLLGEDDARVRSRACTNLALVAKTQAGAAACAAGSGRFSAVAALVGRFEDSDEGVHRAALRALGVACIAQECAECVVSLRTVIPTLLHSLSTPGPVDLQTLQYNVLRACLTSRHNTDALAQCLDRPGADGVDVCTSTLSRHCTGLTPPTAALAEAAAGTLAALCARLDAKGRAVAASAVPLIVRCMGAADLPLRLAATRAACAVLACTEGKQAFAECNGTLPLQSMLFVRHDPLLLVALNCACLASEEPSCRKVLRRFKMQVQQIRAMTKDVDVERAADECLRQFDFSTRPFDLKAGYRPAVAEHDVDRVLQRAEEPVLRWYRDHVEAEDKARKERVEKERAELEAVVGERLRERGEAKLRARLEGGGGGGDEGVGSDEGMKGGEGVGSDEGKGEGGDAAGGDGGEGGEGAGGDGGVVDAKGGEGGEGEGVTGDEGAKGGEGAAMEGEGEVKGSEGVEGDGGNVEVTGGDAAGSNEEGGTGSAEAEAGAAGGASK